MVKEVIKKRIVLTLEDGSMYGFDANFVTRTTYSAHVLNLCNNTKFLRYALIDGKYKPVKSGDGIHVDIRIVGGLTRYPDLLRDCNVGYKRVFLLIAGEDYGSYIAYPNIIGGFGKLTHIEQAHNILKNWAINFVDYYLSGDKYDYEKAKKYVRYWYRDDALKRVASKWNIVDVKFSFRSGF